MDMKNRSAILFLTGLFFVCFEFTPFSYRNLKISVMEREVVPTVLLPCYFDDVCLY